MDGYDVFGVIFLILIIITLIFVPTMFIHELETLDDYHGKDILLYEIFIFTLFFPVQVLAIFVLFKFIAYIKKGEDNKDKYEEVF